MASPEWMQSKEISEWKKREMDKNVENFSKIFDKEQKILNDIRKQEQQSKNEEWNPDDNLESALDFPTEKDVGDWLLDTLKTLNNSNIWEKEKWALKNMIKSNYEIFTSKDSDKLTKVRQGLSFINKEIETLTKDNLSQLDSTKKDNPVIEEKNEQITDDNPIESKEFVQAVSESEWTAISSDQSLAKRQWLFNARQNLLKANWIDQWTVSNTRIIDEHFYQTQEGKYRYVVKIKADVSG